MSSSCLPMARRSSSSAVNAISSSGSSATIWA